MSSLETPKSPGEATNGAPVALGDPAPVELSPFELPPVELPDAEVMIIRE